jgi:hypothetical protein
MIITKEETYRLFRMCTELQHQLRVSQDKRHSQDKSEMLMEVSQFFIDKIIALPPS